MSDGASWTPVRAVALGGGHGLHASLSALRLLTAELTAMVTVADDGGSSGRIRREMKVLPPGDLRMALAALAGTDPAHALWADLLQHRIGGHGVLAGHPVGNLLLTGLMERETDPVLALEQLAELVGAVGRVLPMSPLPLDLVAVADRFDPTTPTAPAQIRGQSSIAATPGRVRSVRLLPTGAPACAAAVDAVREADVVVLGPGIVVHQRHPAPAAARARHGAVCHTGAGGRRAQPGSAGRRDRRLLTASSCSSCCRRTPSRAADCRSTPCWPTPTSVLDPSRTDPTTRARSARVSYCLGSRQTTARNATTRSG